MRSARGCVIVWGLCCAGTAAGALGPDALFSGTAKDELSGALRGMLLKNLPQPLYETTADWGRQAMVPRLRILSRIRSLQGEMPQQAKNDGVWKRLRVDALNPNESLLFDIREVRGPEPGKLTFQIFVSLDTQISYVHQRWEGGLKLLDAEARAKARVKVTLDCEASAQLDAMKGVPDFVIQLKVAKADLKYDNLKFEHIAGLGGEAAQLIGEFAHGAVRQFRPSLERDLLTRANDAIVKAGQSREIRIGVSKLFKSTSPAPKAP